LPIHHETTRLTSKGRVVLPSGIRPARHWQAGTEFRVGKTPEGVLLTPVAAASGALFYRLN
jgi:AbrB family looped-hinge helix DNA binding protein